MPSPDAAAGDDRGINAALLRALPAANNVLELGCATGLLAQRYKGAFPQARWTGVDVSEAALAQARGRVDAAFALDLDTDALERAGGGFDLVVCGDVLEHLKRPERLLTALHAVCTGGARLVCCLPNMSHASVIERLVRGDLMYDESGLLDATHLRFITPRSAFKMLLDAGWLPAIAGGYRGAHPNAGFVAGLAAAGGALGLDPAAVERDVSTYQLVVSCARRPAHSGRTGRATVCVTVAGDDEARLRLNVLRSPGLAEIGAHVVVHRNAGSAAAAFAAGVAGGAEDWVLICADDVYLPRGAGFELLDRLGEIAAEDAATTIVGFAGFGCDDAGTPFRAGLVVDPAAVWDHPAAARALSIADFAVALRRDTEYRIDAGLGRHLWATELCLRAHQAGSARIVRVPMLHDRGSGGTRGPQFAASAARLTARYPQAAAIPTMDGDLRRGEAPLSA